MKYFIKIFFFVFVFLTNCISQNLTNAVYVDSSGRIRWTSNNEEAYFFGLNYSTPFAFSYRALKNKNISHKEIIDLDVQEFKRLGLNAYRIHVWDRELSDKDGNLLINEHIDLLDYLISKLIENDIYIILTPIAWWGTGWPQPDVETSGFSTFYSKIESTTKPEVLKAHTNYLKQFVNHVNSYTGKSYKDEKNIIGFEIFNEPNLPDDVEKINHYINTTSDAIRKEGVTKPVFFNISENPGKQQWEGVASSKVQGVSFQWYPTGLVKYSELKGNFIPNVLTYPIPDYTDKIKNKAKIVYEFDAADIGKSYMYPVMAHSFKKAGIQWAAMFCYDPTSIAQYNSEYSTHYLNLLYTPQKALGFLIASCLFQNEKISENKLDSSSVIMGNTLVDYENDLSLLNTAERFYYTNKNNVLPKDSKELKYIAGFGNSELIKYEGRGAYFLDKINDDLWKLELFPDAVWLKDPFGRNGLDEPIAKMIWKPHQMKINLPELKTDFNVFSKDNISQTAIDHTVFLEPGVYFITNEKNFFIKNSVKSIVDLEKIKKYGEFINDFRLNEIKNLTPSSFYENDEKKIAIEIYSESEKPEAFLYMRMPGWWNYRKFELKKVDDFRDEYNLPSEISSNGSINYFVSIKQNDEILTFPGKLKKTPESWDFNSEDSYKLSIFPASNKITIYDPERDASNLIFSNIWRYAEFGINYTFNNNLEKELSVNINRVKEKFSEFAFQIYVGEFLQNTKTSDTLKLEIKSTSEDLQYIIVRVLFNNSSGFERKIQLSTENAKITIPLSIPEKFKYALLPRPYPTFLPYWFESTPPLNSNINLKPESIQISIPLPEPGKELNNYGIKLKKIYCITN